MNINVTTARRYASRLFEILSPVEMGLFALAMPCFVFSRLAAHVTTLGPLFEGIFLVAAILGLALIFVQGLALTFCDFLRRHEFTARAAEQQKICEQREKKGYRTFKPDANMRKLSMRQRAKLFDVSKA